MNGSLDTENKCKQVFSYEILAANPRLIWSHVSVLNQPFTKKFLDACHQFNMMSEIHQKCKQNYYMKRWYILILYIRKQVKSEVAPLLMEERCFIPPVAELSDSSGSNSEWLQKVGKKPSKRRRLGSLVRRRPKIDDTVQIQLMLSRNGKCKAGCRDPFRRNAGLKELIAFRQAWAQLHKLDQDQVVAWEVYLTHCFKCKSVSYFLLLAAGFSKHFVQLFFEHDLCTMQLRFPNVSRQFLPLLRVKVAALNGAFWNAMCA